ncbi:MAG: helix-turn-helix transcriptional regulator [Anaerofustis stercorihominis]|nr:helix-turn-helix transcriptional regulator [Anaerofustis stercorihominis]
MNKIGDRIYKLRIDHNMSQEALAETLNVSRQAISKWENSMSVPEIEKIIQISEIFDVTTDYLLKGESDFPQNAVNGHCNANSSKDAEISNRKLRQIAGIIFIGMWLLGTLLSVVFHNRELFTLMPYLFFVGMCLLFIKKYAMLTILVVTLVLTLVFGGYILVFDIYLLLIFAEVMCVVYLLYRELKDRSQ